MSNLLSGPELRLELEGACNSLRSRLTVHSAFVKANGIRWLQGVVPSGVEVRIVARWQLHDLSVGASDLECYELCRDLGWRFGIDQESHCKVFIFDDERVYLGSSNLTPSGLWVGIEGNIEMGTMLRPTVRDMQKMRDLQERACWINDELYALIQAECLGITSDPSPGTRWSPELNQRLCVVPRHLWVEDLLSQPPERLLMPGATDPDVKHDLALLGIEEGCAEADVLYERFLGTREFSWLRGELEGAEEEFTSFGWVTARLRGAAISNPGCRQRAELFP